VVGCRGTGGHALCALPPPRTRVGGGSGAGRLSVVRSVIVHAARRRLSGPVDHDVWLMEPSDPVHILRIPGVVQFLHAFHVLFWYAPSASVVAPDAVRPRLSTPKQPTVRRRWCHATDAATAGCFARSRRLLPMRLRSSSGWLAPRPPYGAARLASGAIPASRRLVSGGVPVRRRQAHSSWRRH
jgi:hypothetical protein